MGAATPTIASTNAAPFAIAAKGAGVVKAAGIAAGSHAVGFLGIILLIPFSLIALAIAFFLGTGKESPPRHRIDPGMLFRRIRNLAIPVTLFLIGGILLGLAAVRIRHEMKRKSIAVAAGASGSEGRYLMQSLKNVSIQTSAKIDVTLLAPGSDADNLQRLTSSDASFALAGSEIAPVPVARSVATLYDNLSHLLVHKDSTIARFQDLKGKRVGLPQSGDDYRVFLALAKYYSLGEADFTFVGGDQDAADATFASSESDAIFRLRSSGSPYIKTIMLTTGAVLLPIGDAAAIRLQLPGYEAGTVPRGAYSVNPPLPYSDTPTVATRRVLYARNDVDPEIVFDLASILFQHRAELAAALPDEARSLRQLATAARKPPATSFDAAVHYGVQSYDHGNQDPSAVRWTTIVVLFAGGLLLCAAAILEWRRAMRRVQKFQLDLYNSRMFNFLESPGRKTTKDSVAVHENLHAIQREAIEDLKHDKLSPEGFAAFQSVWNAAMQRAQKA